MKYGEKRLVIYAGEKYPELCIAEFQLGQICKLKDVFLWQGSSDDTYDWPKISAINSAGGYVVLGIADCVVAFSLDAKNEVKDTLDRVYRRIGIAK